MKRRRSRATTLLRHSSCPCGNLFSILLDWHFSQTILESLQLQTIQQVRATIQFRGDQLSHATAHQQPTGCDLSGLRERSQLSQKSERVNHNNRRGEKCGPFEPTRPSHAQETRQCEFTTCEQLHPRVAHFRSAVRSWSHRVRRDRSVDSLGPDRRAARGPCNRRCQAFDRFASARLRCCAHAWRVRNRQFGPALARRSV